MPAPIPEWKRANAVADYKSRKAEDGRTSIRQVARDHGVGEASLKRWLWRDRELGSVAPIRKRRRTYPKLPPVLRDEVASIVLAEPSLRLYEVADRIVRRPDIL